MTAPGGPTPMTRRRVLGAFGGVAAVAAMAELAGAGGAWSAGRVPGGRYPFSLGVASGDPEPHGVVLWTRLAPEPFVPGGGMARRPEPVDWQVAADDGFRAVLRAGTAVALPELAHAVHVEVAGLPPGRELFYRFRHGAELSPVGRTRTAPAAGARVGRLRFAFASCQDWTHGFYSAYRNMAEEDLDLVVHLGDYVYEYGIPAGGGARAMPTADVLRPAPRDLERWRMQYALYRTDPDLQRVHARFPWLVTWDDHEVQNDYAGTRSQDEGDITALRAAAYQAWYEHQAVRRPARPGPSGPRVHRRTGWGDLGLFHVLDGRQHRTVPPCSWGEGPDCADARDPSVTMLGDEQERWLFDGLTRSRARWNVLANNVMLARLDHDGDRGDVVWHDSWDGFPAARNRLTDHLVNARVRNPVVVTGDWHSTFVNDIHRDADADRSPVVATEFVGTSISSNGDAEVYGPYYGPMIRDNPHIRFFDGDRRGYVRCIVDRRTWHTDLRMVSSVSTADAPVSTLAGFVVEDGRAGARPA